MVESTFLRLPAVFMRGGTSKAVMFRRDDLPPDQTQWDAIFLQVMGSPDPYGRQLDGMGGGISSLSKICVVGPSSRTDADVDFTFVQIAVETSIADYSGNCGNMSSAVGPFAVEEGMVASPGDGECLVRIHNTNTGKIIHSRFPVSDGVLAADGDCHIDGVAGTAAAIKLEFLQPGGAKTGHLLPTLHTRDKTELPDGRVIEVSCIDAGNPCVFVAARDLGKTGAELPEDLAADSCFMSSMEQIRCFAAVQMGIAKDSDHAKKIPAIPKVAMVAAAQSTPTIDDGIIVRTDNDLCVRMLSVGQPHRAVPVTGAICLAVACRIPGTIPHAVCDHRPGPVRIAHPSGTVLVDAEVTTGPDGEPEARFGAVYRTARRLFEGQVVYRSFQ